MSNKIFRESCEYHSRGRKGKISIQLTKSCKNQKDLTLAYSPGVAGPCIEITNNIEKIWEYTAKGNMVAVVSDGTAVLGLGNIGPEAGLPVMEGKAVLFKAFAGIDAIPICLNNVFDTRGKTDPDKLISVVRSLEPTFGGINLEDIGAPACFKVESELKKIMNIPVFHDDQHGTAIISLAGLLNACKITGRKLQECKIVINGAGAAGISCAETYILAGARRENFILCDSKGVISKKRRDILPESEKGRFIADTNAETLADALIGADIFIGLSVANCVTKEMIKTMAKDPIVFAMANPEPEINPMDAIDAGAAVAGTGRSDYPNQVNNVLGFPGIFRGALDTRARDINNEMKLAAANALAELANEKIDDKAMAILAESYPEDYKKGYFNGNNPLKPELLIPKPFDPRVVPRVARYVAEAAIKTSTARTFPILDSYEDKIKTFLSTQGMT
ncbi:MAG TPA: malic enzyme-like NAD(P)-binding protein [Victivallales bacterium]|nr:malic enzyme-like NAD(P)-binding protein [Victivallales bacterium]HRR06368.1 malic enzyme-like NAD(P)-binding protein [Victivallales bacterium]HRR28700.1 malic enzyme-like NAD(P)-binding protein [Victivallales bacterium]